MNYRSYYTRQAGEGIQDYYSGQQYQRGSGLGSIFSSLARTALPMLKEGASYIGRKLLNSGMNVVGDVTSGENFKDSLKKRSFETMEGVRSDAVRKICENQTGSGNNKRRRTVKRAPVRRKTPLRKQAVKRPVK